MDGIRALHDLLGGDSNLVSTTVPVGDGLAHGGQARVTAYRPIAPPDVRRSGGDPVCERHAPHLGRRGGRRGRRLDLRLDRARARARLRPGARGVVPALARVPHDLRRRRAAPRAARDDGASRTPRRARSCACRAAAARSSAATPGTTCTRTATRSCACWSCTRRRPAPARRARMRARKPYLEAADWRYGDDALLGRLPGAEPARRTLHEPRARVAPLAGGARRPLRQHRASHRRPARAESGRGLAHARARRRRGRLRARGRPPRARVRRGRERACSSSTPTTRPTFPKGVAHEYRSYGSRPGARALRRRALPICHDARDRHRCRAARRSPPAWSIRTRAPSRRASSAARGPSAARTRCSPTASPWRSGWQPGGRACRSAIGVCELIDLDGHVRSAQTLEWRDVDVAGAFGPLGPAVVESDVRAAALAEAHFGAGRGVQELLFVIVGTGISCCLVLGGRAYAGARGNAICFGAPPLEEAASGLALAAPAAASAQRRCSPTPALDSVVEAAAARARRRASPGWSTRSIPATVVIGGGLGLVDRYRELAVEAMRPLIFADNTRDVPVVPAELGMDAGRDRRGARGRRSARSLDRSARRSAWLPISAKISPCEPRAGHRRARQRRPLRPRAGRGLRGGRDVREVDRRQPHERRRRRGAPGPPRGGHHRRRRRPVRRVRARRARGAIRRGRALRGHAPDAAHAARVRRDGSARGPAAAVLPRARGAGHADRARRHRPRRRARGGHPLDQRLGALGRALARHRARADARPRARDDDPRPRLPADVLARRGRGERGDRRARWSSPARRSAIARSAEWRSGRPIRSARPAR